MGLKSKVEAAKPLVPFKINIPSPTIKLTLKPLPSTDFFSNTSNNSLFNRAATIQSVGPPPLLPKDTNKEAGEEEESNCEFVQPKELGSMIENKFCKLIQKNTNSFKLVLGNALKEGETLKKGKGFISIESQKDQNPALPCYLVFRSFTGIVLFKAMIFKKLVRVKEVEVEGKPFKLRAKVQVLIRTDEGKMVKEFCFIDFCCEQDRKDFIETIDSFKEEESS